MVSFQIVSDLHIEYRNNYIHDPFMYITPVADILILAGDIGSLYKMNQLYSFLSTLCEKFKLVLYIAGNHEYYMTDGFKPLKINALNNRLYELENNIQNLLILKNSSIVIGDVCITGCTLWSKPMINVPKYLVRTYKVLEGSKIDRFVSLYVNQLDNLLQSDKVHTWVAGHIHYNFDFVTEGGTRVVGNQRGKPRDKIDNFSKEFVINI